MKKVNFWQTLDSPMNINVTPSVMNPDGSVEKDEAQAMSNIFAYCLTKRLWASLRSSSGVAQRLSIAQEVTGISTIISQIVTGMILQRMDLFLFWNRRK